ncbi:MAG: CPBP family intramembrane metalloprotease [Acidimicrobiia bacterium]|nr:CPBP family intramembrane metalloprotease [Acidimicrobiia bacterium]
MAKDLSETGKQHAWSWPLSDWDAMWRPSMWRRSPPSPHRAHIFHLAAIYALALYANVVANELLDGIWHIPFQLGILGFALVISRRAGTTWTSLGLRRDRLKRGAVVGGVLLAIITIGIVIGIAIPATRDLFRDEKVAEASAGWVLFQALVRIPIATALYEEVLFRGIMFGMLVRRHTPLVAGVITSVLFGFWHILPTLHTIETNPAGDMFTGSIGITIAIIGAIAGTTMAGIGFLLIRLYANSTLAPVLAHIGTNSVAMLGALVVIRYL